MPVYSRITAWIDIDGNRYGPFGGDLVEVVGTPVQNDFHDWYGVLHLSDPLQLPFESLSGAILVLEDGRQGSIFSARTVRGSRWGEGGVIHFKGSGYLAPLSDPDE